jgi:hypothetical protein
MGGCKACRSPVMLGFRIFCLVIFSNVFSGFENPVFGQASSDPVIDTKESKVSEAQKLFDFFSILSERFDAKLATGESVQSDGKSLLNWTVSDSWHGSFFVWTSKGKPVLVGCLLSDSETPNFRRSFIELHSMTDASFTPLAFAGIKKYIWNPDPKKSVPITIEAVVGASDESNAASASARRIQMRKIAESFNVTMYDEVKKGEGSEQLRMLTSPLYRYPSIADDGVDGAIYAFVTSKGTDPEFLLAVENIVKNDKSFWRIKPMRFCTRKLELRRASSVVWSVEEYNESGIQTNLRDPYMIVTLVETSTSQFNTMRDKIRELDTRRAQPR